MTSGIYAIRKPIDWASVFSLFAQIIAPVAFAAAAWAHGRLWDLNERTAVLEVKRSADDKETDAFHSQVDMKTQQILERLDLTNQRLQELTISVVRGQK